MGFVMTCIGEGRGGIANWGSGEVGYRGNMKAGSKIRWGTSWIVGLRDRFPWMFEMPPGFLGFKQWFLVPGEWDVV